MLLRRDDDDSRNVPMTPVREAMSSSSLLPTDSEEVEGETSRDGAEAASFVFFTGVASMTLLVVVRMTESKSARSKRVVAGMLLLIRLLVDGDGGRQR